MSKVANRIVCTGDGQDLSDIKRKNVRSAFDITKSRGCGLQTVFSSNTQAATNSTARCHNRQIQRHEAAGATVEGKLRKAAFGPISAPCALQCCLYNALTSLRSGSCSALSVRLSVCQH